jgi:molecular chaperone GrpE
VAADETPPSTPPAPQPPSPQEELDELKDKYYRLLADGENQRKRLQKDKMEGIKSAEVSTITSFLEPLDHLENALKFATHASPDVKQWAVGFEMILGQFKEILSRHKVAPFSSLGHHYDHEKHDAVDIEETEDVAPGTIMEEYQRGYVMEGKTIRPAKVKVAKARAEPEELQEKREES